MSNRIGAMPQGLANFAGSIGLIPEDYGAKADNIADDSAIINSTAALALAAGTFLRFTPGKTYYCGTTQLLFKCHVDGAESFLRWGTDYTGTAVVIGDVGGAYTTAKTMRIPRINMGKTNYDNWAAVPNSIGVKIWTVENCNITLAGCSNFANGVWLDATANKGASYNKFFLGDFIDCQKAVRIECTNATGWLNQNNWYGGRVQISSGAGTNVPWTRGIYIKTYATANAITTTQSMSVTSGTQVITWAGGDFTAAGFYKGGTVTFSGFANAGNNKPFRVIAVGTTTMTLAANSVGLVTEGPTASVTATMEGAPFGYLQNANNFFGTSLETIPIEAMIEIKGGWFNDFFGCRFEQAASPVIFLTGMGSNASTKFNVIKGGYTAGGNDFTVFTGVFTFANSIECSERMMLSNSGSYGAVQYANAGSDTYPWATIWPSSVGDTVLAKPTGTNWHFQLGGYYLDGKSAANTVPAVRIAGQTGRIYFGDGSTALGSNYFTVFGANTGIQQAAGWFVLPGTTGNTLRITSGTANSTVATTLGSTGPTGSTAGAPQGWMRISVAGTDRFIPYW